MDNTIWDPLRRKYVALTPEERVRQWFIKFLTDVVRVPVGLMTSEAAISLGAKRFRADILVYDRSLSPLAVVECKRSEVELGQAVLDQAVRYNMVLNVKYIIITNGHSTCICRKDGRGGYSFIDEIPSYSRMCSDDAESAGADSAATDNGKDRAQTAVPDSADTGAQSESAGEGEAK